MSNKKTKTEMMMEVLISELDKLKSTTKDVEAITDGFKKDIDAIKSDFKEEIKEIKAEPLKIDRTALNDFICKIEGVESRIQKGYIFPNWLIYLGIFMFVVLAVFSVFGAWGIYIVWLK